MNNKIENWRTKLRERINEASENKNYVSRFFSKGKDKANHENEQGGSGTSPHKRTGTRRMSHPSHHNYKNVLKRQMKRNKRNSQKRKRNQMLTA